MSQEDSCYFTSRLNANQVSSRFAKFSKAELAKFGILFIFAYFVSKAPPEIGDLHVPVITAVGVS